MVDELYVALSVGLNAIVGAIDRESKLNELYTLEVARGDPDESGICKADEVLKLTDVVSPVEGSTGKPCKKLPFASTTKLSLFNLNAPARV